MVLENPTQPVLDQIAATLRAGNRLWLVGEIPLSQARPPEVIPILSPTPISSLESVQLIAVAGWQESSTFP